MKRALIVLIAGTVLSGLAAAYAAAKSKPTPTMERKIANR